MDYLEMILRGCSDENSREHLTNYIYREYKKAEKEHYNLAEFFGGCKSVIDGWEQNLKKQIHERKKELSLMLSGSKNGTMSFGDLNGRTLSEAQKETIEFCKSELSNVRPDGIGSVSYSVHLHSLTKARFSGSLFYPQILAIKRDILQAQIKAHYDNDETAKAMALKLELIGSGLVNASAADLMEIEPKKQNVELSYKEIAGILNASSNLDIRKRLDELYDNIQDKKSLIDYLKYEFLPKRKSKIKHDSEILSGSFAFAKMDAENRTECLEQWLTEKEGSVKEEKKLTMSQLALIHAYRGEVITRDNGGQIAKDAGYNSKTSGDKLYQLFTKFFNSADRKGDAGTKKKNQNKIKLIESIIESLPKDKQQRAKDEVSILKSIQETQYE